MKTRIRVDKISKKFNMDLKKQNLLERVLLFIDKKQSQPQKELKVFENVSFEIGEGEIVGLIGKNGSGKSTLLKIIAKIYNPDSGNVYTNGNLIYLNGLRSGLMPKLTMRENIFLMGSIMGLSQEDIRKKFDEIVDFSGLKEFVENKVCHFSSGMVMRLNFSATMHCLEHKNPDILLLDEVFGSGGDIDFQKKSLAKMEELIKGGATVILASHSMSLIKKYCDKSILLERGKITKQGPSNEVVSFYERQTI